MRSGESSGAEKGIGGMSDGREVPGAGEERDMAWIEGRVGAWKGVRSREGE